MSGLAGVIFSANLSNLYVTAGASSAIFGLIGTLSILIILTDYSVFRLCLCRLNFKEIYFFYTPF